MTGSTERDAIVQAPANFWMFLEWEDMVSVEVSSTLPTPLADEIITSENCPRPLPLFEAGTSTTPASPASILTANPTRILLLAAPLVSWAAFL